MTSVSKFAHCLVVSIVMSSIPQARADRYTGSSGFRDCIHVAKIAYTYEDDAIRVCRGAGSEFRYCYKKAYLEFDRDRRSAIRACHGATEGFSYCYNSKLDWHQNGSNARKIALRACSTPLPRGRTCDTMDRDSIGYQLTCQ